MRIVTRVFTIVALFVAARAWAMPDLQPWNGVWFAARVAESGLQFHQDAPGYKHSAGGGKVYMQLHWDAAAPDYLAADIWDHTDAGWRKQTLALQYFGGSGTDIVVWFSNLPTSPTPLSAAQLYFSLALRLKGTASGGTVTKATLSTAGGHVLEVDDAPGSDERWASTLVMKGKLTTNLPSDLPH